MHGKKDPAGGKQVNTQEWFDLKGGWEKWLCFLQTLDFCRKECIARMFQFASSSLPAQAILFSNFDFDNGKVIISQEYGGPDGFRDGSLLNGTVCFDQFVLKDAAFALYEDIRQSPYQFSDADLLKHGYRSYLGCPVKLNGDVIGCIELFHSAPGVFNTFHAGAIGTIATLISFIVSHHKLQSSIEDRLSESEALNYQMLQLSPAAIYKIDLIEQRFQAVNDHMCRATGYSEKELLATSPLELLTPQSRLVFAERCQMMATGQAVSSSVELEIVTKTGTSEWGQFHIRHIYRDNKIVGANVVAHFITEQKRIREELNAYRKKLEMLVQDRTAELAEKNSQLREEIKRRAEATERLRISSDSLKEMNTAMRVLLDKRTEDHHRAEEVIRTNLKELIDPYLERLENSGLDSGQKQLLNVIRMNLEDVMGSAMPELSSKYYMLSPNEIQVVNLIRKGKTTKQISRLLNLSVRTIEAYRNNIRKKLNLKNKKVNLRTYLSSF